MKDVVSGCPGQGAGRPDPSRAEDPAILSDEVGKILASAAFLRAPILSRLLRYLHDQTLAGTADRLKAYTVAVDGLARAADFDAQLDSYPRVQIVRLRKALENHYGEVGNATGQCVFLGVGSYRLRLALLPVAYPALAEKAMPDRGEPADVLPLADRSRRPFRLVSYGRVWAGLAISICIVGLLGLAVTALRDAATARRGPGTFPVTAMQAPIATFAVNGGANTPQAKAVASIVSDGLRRSWVARIRDASVTANEIEVPPTYNVVVHVVDGGRLDVELVDARSGTILWTGSGRGQAGDDGLREGLAPVIAMISGPYGVIARNETSRLRDGSTGSYACILRYFAFVKARDPEEGTRVTACLEQPVDDPRLGAAIGAVRSFFILESRVARDRAAQIAAAEQFARGAAQQNADDPYAQYAMARLAYLRGHCAEAGSHSDRAVAANPYDSMIVTVLAGLAAQCDHPRATELLDRAYRIRNDNDVAMRGFLVLATLAQGESGRLAEVGFLLRPPPGPQLPGYLLTESMIAAAQGRTAEAAARWSEFRKLYPGAGPSDDDRLKMIVLSDPLRRRLLGLLRDKGVIRALETPI